MTEPDYLTEAVAARLQLASGQDRQAIDTVMVHLMPDSFVDDEGHIDQERVNSFVASLQGPPTIPQAASGDPVAAALARQRAERKIPSPSISIHTE